MILIRRGEAILKPEAVIFDMDGVIFDSERAIYQLALELAEEEGVPDLPKIYMSLIGITREKSKQILTDFYGPDFPYARYREILSARYHQRYDHGRLPLKPGIHTILKDLSAVGMQLSVASSTPRPTVARQLDEAGLASFFQVIIGGNQVKYSKPAPDIFLCAASSMNVSPEACYVIEDSYNGIRAAYAGGMIPVMIPDMLEPNDEIRSLAAAVLPDLFSASTWIRQNRSVRARLL